MAYVFLPAARGTDSSPTTRYGRAPALSPLAGALGKAGLLALLIAPPVWAQTTTELERVELIGTSPLPGQGVDRELLPYSTQLLRRDRIDGAQAVNSTDLLNRRTPGVQVNDIQGSPFQGDLTYRGFRASPLLGAGQGLSVYLDGVRINEPFGDVINFDLIPEFAISSIALVPGANPAFGLNSLGGALAYTTFDGRSAPGARAEASLGSFGRKRASVSLGGSSENGWHHYIAATVFDEEGWRDASDGRILQALGKVGRDDGETAWTTSLLLGASDLVGNGLLPAYTIDDGELTPDLYFHRRRAVYTHPDQTKNYLTQLSFNLQHALDASRSISALLYVRDGRRNTINGDEAEEEPEDPGDPNAAFNTTETKQTGFGAGVSYAATTGVHQWQVGATLDHSRVGYRQFEREGFFTPTRGVVPGDEERELSADVDGSSTSFGLYASDTWKVAPRTHVTGTVRYNRARVSNQLSTVDDDTDEFEVKPRERFTYNAVNPALGIAHRLEGGPTLFANVARNNRVPTVIELGCADPEEPCRLPAGLQADPFLEQVKSTTVELGTRWPLAPGVRFELAAYRTDNRDDILFRSTSVSGQLGYFANFPKTRNQGVDAELSAALGAFEFGVGYSLLKATYEADGVLRQGERNVVIRPGTRIAGLPRHTLKLAADWRPGNGFSLGADLQAVTSRGVSGNEDGLLEDPEEGEDLEAGRLRIPGYAILNLRSSWKPNSQVELYASVNNVFDKRYETFGALAETVFTPTGAYAGGDEADALSVAPGAPRAFVVGVRIKF